MKWGLFVVVGLAALVAIMAMVGSKLPREHRASRTARLPRPPEAVFPIIMRIAAASRVPVDVLQSQPPHVLVTRVKASETQFGGTWTISITPMNDGSTVTITEDGWVASPVFRFLSRYVIGHGAAMDGLLKNVVQEMN